MAFLRSDTPVAIRLTITTLLFTVVLGLAIAIPPSVAPGGVARFLVTYALVIAALGTFAGAGTPDRPYLPLVLSVGVAFVGAIAVLALMGPVVPVRPALLGNQASLLLTAALAGGVLVTLSRSRRVALALVVALGLKGLLVFAAGVTAVASAQLTPSMQPVFVLNAAWILASLAAIWYSRVLPRAAAGEVDSAERPYNER